MSRLGKMQPVTAGILTEYINFNLTSLCMRYFLDRQYTKQCSSILALWPSGAGALLYLQVSSELFQMKLTTKGVPTKAFPFSDDPKDLLENGSWTSALD
jgi:hypothetical protein